MPRSAWLLVALLGACSFDWDGLDPRQGTSPTSDGGAGGASASSSSSSTGSSSSSSSSSGTGGSAPECGDGVVSGDEQCDDGGQQPGDGCDADCAIECPGGFVHPTTLHCYVIELTPMSWQSARDVCMALGPGFDLVAMSTQAEYDWFIAQPEFVAALAQDRIWTGGNDRDAEDVYEYANGEPWLDSLWAAGQPDDFMGSAGGPVGPGEDCVHFRDPAFNDLACGASESFACERPPPALQGG